jgi:hypothetical protein
VDVAFQSPSHLILRGHKALPGRPEVLDQTDVRQDQARLSWCA